MPQVAAHPRHPFLALPAEIRLEIYSNMAVPRDNSFWYYRGLYMSCSQVRNEMDHECGKILRKHLEEIKNSWPSTFGLGLLIPKGFSDMHRVVLRIPELFISLTAVEHINKHQRFFMDLSPLFTLHLQSITMRIETRETNRPRKLTYGNMIKMTGMCASTLPKNHVLYNPSAEANTRRIMLDTTYIPLSRLRAEKHMRSGQLTTCVDLDSLASRNSHYVRGAWETWTIDFSNGKKIVFWVKEVKGKEWESTQLWTKKMSAKWRLTPHRRH
ncbi:hypothetical protein CFE70_006351 [Pyrenophora teres f. teres 0-1]|uniref:Uncharacterized protein n=2 Tax=Pyrenophora teres f. teres TaxID=97479 RepID=E3RRA1_PYRTT|nr:hypothetical protein PTT_11321 [Pyrenophora teres f. teres 0-1]KAE8827970.1 hypothetical protein HRS9139_07189 [Pyrenophora teres f. teres]CAA9962927.1 hypothetical protein PTMSG1_06295 [Pyrenophora teres f. maculata]KAE8829606.1 hypothetical protein HRS9122_09421 [Pyrenophora teres f. teres]KAE8857431.1 hypothetical protein PTNB29_08498 [Pyrenophora teres f. teres]